MKKFITSAACMMTLIVAGMGFASCSSADEAEVNPTYDPVAGTVNADFVFNISTGNSTQTRQNAANTQATIDQVFRGIDNAHLFAYKMGTTNDGKHIATATDATKTYSLGTLLANNALDPDGSTPKSRRIIELSLPVETNCLMFWGKAPKTGTDAEQGKISFTATNKDLTQHAFSLQPVINGNTAAVRQYEELILAILNDLGNVKYEAAAGALVWTAADGGDGSSNTDPISISWADYSTGSQSTSSSSLAVAATCPLESVTPADGPALSSLGEIMADAFVRLHKIYSGELRSGSGQSVHYVLKDLYEAINPVTTTQPTSYREFIVQQLAIKVKESLEKAIENTGEFKNIVTIKSAYGKSSLTSVANDLDAFPTNYGLPTGGTQLLCVVDPTATPKVTWSYNMNPLGPGTGTTTASTAAFPINKCMFPAELCYFGNSPLHAIDQVRTADQYPDGAGSASGEWMNSGSWTDWTMNGHVKSTSRAVAMAQNINYGTALLKTTVSYGAATLQDNNAAIQHERANGAVEANKSISVTTASDRFQLVGILVGGQEATMGWNYIAKATTPTWDYVIYDSQIPSGNIPAYTGSTPTPSQPVYTLVWDNYNAALANNAQQKVYVALEFINNSATESFWGEKNLVRAGGRFYLIGALDPTDASLTPVTWPAATEYALPPYNADGSTIQAQRVFIQDYMTTANFVINETSLQHAYVTVPDLRSTQISLGLSVDLNWRAGLDFGDVVLGQ